MDGMEFLKQAAGRTSTATIITMSAYGTMDLALETMQLGAYDFISKPFKPTEVLLVLKKAEERERLKKENRQLRSQLKQLYGFENLIGKSPQMQGICELIGKVAAFKSSVLITGESGTGKELVARAIHETSPRKERIFLGINCGAIPDSLLESELFGHKKGSFTGAIQDRKGFFEEADGGTLFLDEIGDIPINLQVKLIRALQEGEVRRVGEDRAVSVDVRVIAATAKDLLAEVERGSFREDLYYRLNVLPIHLPPLRERLEDIQLLVEHFIAKYNKSHGLACRGATPAAMRLLLAYPWPGNIRELENMVERAMILSEKDRIDADDIPAPVAQFQKQGGKRFTDDIFSIKVMSRIIEEQFIRKALKRTHGNKSQAAKLLELSYPALLSKIAEYGIVNEE
jgi:two-component system response regulator AtoC